MAQKEIYLVVPTLIEQPTWGGTYIAAAKGLESGGLLEGRKIGQSYELSSHSLLVPFSSLLPREKFQDARAEVTAPLLFELKASGSSTLELNQSGFTTCPVADLIREQPDFMLGAGLAERYGLTMPLLIKFTQALGNSFQLHVKEKDESTSNWLAKPESWFFFEPGSVTLGLRPGADVEAYHAVCRELEKRMQSLSRDVLADLISLTDAEKQAKRYVAESNIGQYVNCFAVEADTVADPSAGGIHHSWEEDPNNAPLGNIVYEVQRNRSDEASTIRSFDKGKFNPDGTVRELQIEDYFRHLDRSLEANDPSRLLSRPVLVREDAGGRLERVFRSSYYECERIILNDHVNKWQEQTEGSFHHLFVKEGALTVCPPDDAWCVGIREGWSVFIPAGYGEYRIQGHGGMRAEVIKTRIPKTDQPRSQFHLTPP